MYPFSGQIYRLLTKAVFIAAIMALAAAASASRQYDGPKILQTCTSGQFEAKLTGWALNNKMPMGKAEYKKSAKALKVIVSSVALGDGTVLEVRNGDNKIGETLPLKDSETTAMIDPFDMGDDLLVGIWENDRPIVTGSLKCVEVTAAKK